MWQKDLLGKTGVLSGVFVFGGGLAGVFFEAHPTPDTALSDGPNSLDLKLAEKMARELCLIDQVVKKFK